MRRIPPPAAALFNPVVSPTIDDMSNFDSATRSVAVVGGGISGLATAWRVAELQPGWRVVVLEAADRAGGVIHTDRTGDYTLELGPDSILRRLPWGVGLCQRLGIDDQLVGTQPAARGVYTVHRGQLARMPEGLAIMAPERVWPMVTTPILSPWGKLRLACERVVPRRTDDADESLAAFARRRLGREAFERIVQPMAGGIYMGDPERLSLRGCFPQFADMEAKQGSLIKATRQAARERKAAASDKTAGQRVCRPPRWTRADHRHAHRETGAAPCESVSVCRKSKKRLTAGG